VSLFLGALFIVRQQGIKRLMAYSSIEHMGVVALGFGFGGALGVAGELYHMLNHSLNKSLMFFGAGIMMRAYGTKEIANARSTISRRLRQAAQSPENSSARSLAPETSCSSFAHSPAKSSRPTTANGYRAMWAAEYETAVRSAVDTARLAGAGSFQTILQTIAWLRRQHAIQMERG
jgi:Proton-conducting membrane transporter